MSLATLTVFLTPSSGVWLVPVAPNGFQPELIHVVYAHFISQSKSDGQVELISVNYSFFMLLNRGKIESL